MATPGKKGFYASWQSASQQVAIIVSASLGFALNAWLAPAQLDDWGWRIPFFIGCLIVPFVFFIRRSLQETDEFLARKHHPTPREIYRSILANWSIVLAGMMMVIMTTVSFYLITVYTPTFGKTVLKLSAADGLIVTICVGLSNFIWLPIMGALSDRIGRRPILITFSTLAFLTAYPALSWLAEGPTFPKMLMVELWLSFIYASYNGAMIVALTEVMPVGVRTSGFSLAYSLATTFGGFTAAICTWLIATTGDNASPGYWMSAAAICGLAGTFFVYRTQERPALSGASSGERVIGA